MSEKESRKAGRPATGKGRTIYVPSSKLEEVMRIIKKTSPA